MVRTGRPIRVVTEELGIRADYRKSFREDTLNFLKIDKHLFPDDTKEVSEDAFRQFAHEFLEGPGQKYFSGAQNAMSTGSQDSIEQETLIAEIMSRQRDHQLDNSSRPRTSLSLPQPKSRDDSASDDLPLRGRKRVISELG